MTRTLRALLVGCCGVSSVCAFEYGPFTVPGGDPAGADAAPIQATISAGSGITLTIAQRRPATSNLSGGVEVLYERIRIACDAMDIAQSAIAGSSETVLDQGRVSPGPKGPTPDRVLFDTRETRLPTIGFRGLLTPGSALLERQAVPAPPPAGSGPPPLTLAPYRVLMTSLGEWSGDLRGKGGEWMPFAGWSERAEVLLEAPVLDRGLGQPRLRAITLHGTADGARKAEIRRLAAPVPGAPPAAAAVAGAAAGTVDASVQATWIRVQFDDVGEVAEIRLHDDAKVQGDLVPARPKR